MKKVSILIPCYNEEDNVVDIAKAVCKQMSKLPQYDYELVFIDNASTDGTRDLIRGLCASNSKIKAILNARNFGQFSSPYYGMLQTTGDCVITMVCDFQDPVSMIPLYLKEWEDGYKIVLGQKTRSNESRLIYGFRNFYYNFLKKHSELDFLKQVTGSGLYDRSFVEVMKQVDDSKPFLRGIVAELGYGIRLIPYTQPERRAGKSKNTFYGYVNIAAQSLTAYTRFGCRLALGCGVVATIGSMVALLAFVIYDLLSFGTINFGSELLGLIILLVVSMNLFFIGVVGEYTMDANFHTRKRPMVIEEERINFK